MHQRWKRGEEEKTVARKTTLDGEINELGGERGGERGERERRGRKSNECEQRKEGEEGGSRNAFAMRRGGGNGEEGAANLQRETLA